MERNWEAEAAEMRVSEDERWELAQWQWEQEHEGEWDNYVPDEPLGEEDVTAPLGWFGNR